MKKGNKMFRQSVMNKVEELAKSLEHTKSLINLEPQWSNPVKISEAITTKGIGVYKISHADLDIAYIGQGNVSSRRYRHLGVFKNNGKDMVSINGHVSPSQAGKKMYAYDSNLENWFFSYCIIGSKVVAVEYEKLLAEDIEPAFNNLSMAGKS